MRPGNRDGGDEMPGRPSETEDRRRITEAFTPL
ncbi:hypothetical protein QFZ75_002620 [Streptomyces sp. V3I8]|nr:hypothetical protein [Streptomyces sp. V3I8]